MIQDIRSLMSLAHIKKSNPGGQIATILILMLTALLIFVLATINLGKISLNTTQLDNASDAAALSLASQLATKGNVYSHSLRSSGADETSDTKACNKGSFLSVVLAIVFAVIVTIITWGGGISAWEFVAIVAAGAVGGLVGAAISGTDLVEGALQGAIIGAAIGGGAMLGAEMGAAAGGIHQTAGGAYYVYSMEGITYIEASSAAGAAGVVGGSVATATIVGATLGVGLVAGCKLYNATTADQMRSDAMAAASKKLNGLPEYDRYREGVFLQVLSKLADDPNTVVDTVDSDGDGDVTEKVPNFQVWWDARVDKIKEVTGKLKTPTESFLNSLEAFKDDIYDQNHCKTEYAGDSEWGYSYTYTPGPFSRQELEKCGGEYKDGIVIELLRVLESKVPGGVSFWEPGPSAAALAAIEGCETCPEPAGWDDVDEMLLVFDEFRDYVASVQTLRYDGGIDYMVSTFQSWFSTFYDPETTDDYYSQLGKIKEELSDWKIKIEFMRNQLPTCVYTGGYEEEATCSNPPCKFGGIGTLGGSIDQDIADEFQPAEAVIDELIAKINNFQGLLVSYYNQMNVLLAELSGLGGLNPATYTWTDTIGQHSVSAETGPFKIPRLKSTKSGPWYRRKYCMEMKDYSDNGSRTWVRVTRTDPANVQIGILGPWNPSVNTITRLSRVSYSYNQTPRIAGIK